MSTKEKLSALRHSGLSFCVFRFPEEDQIQLAVHSGSTLTPLEKGIVLHPFSKKEADIHHLGNLFFGNLEDWEGGVQEIAPLKNSISLRQRKSISRAEYLQKCEIAIEKMKNGLLDKVVLNVVKELENRYSPEVLFERIESLYPDAFIHWTVIDGQPSWLGASPELLLRRKGQDWETMSLAGTRVKGAPPMTHKEEEEQDIVTRYIVNALTDRGVEGLNISGQTEKQAGHLLHLCNHIEFKSNLGEAEILEALHPTPAVCGHPRESAIDTISELNMMQRDYYCGYIGVKQERQTEYYVNLRCMEIRGDKAYVFVGGGVTASSVPESEWEEMNQKTLTMSRILM